MSNITYPKTFCTLPFVHISNTSSGEFVPCCLSNKSISNENGRLLNIFEGDTFESALKTPQMNQLRHNLLNNIRDSNCNRCWALEDLGLQSKRIYDGNRFLRKAERFLDQKQDSFQPLSWDIKLGSLCNLKCRMCDAESSSLILTEDVQRGLIEPAWAQQFLSNTSDFFKYPSFASELEHLSAFAEEIYFLGGEPTLNKAHVNILNLLIKNGRSKSIDLRWSTNMTHFEDSFIELASHFKNLILDCSVDGYGPLNNYIRFPSKWNTIEKNIFKVKTFLPTAEIKIVCTVSMYNIFQLDELYEWANLNGLNVVLNFLDQPAYLCAQNLNEQIKNEVISYYNGSAHMAHSPILVWLKGEGSSEKLFDFVDHARKLDILRKQKLMDSAHEFAISQYQKFYAP